MYSQFRNNLDHLLIYRGDRIWVIDEDDMGEVKLKEAKFHSRPLYPGRQFSVVIDGYLKFKYLEEIFMSESDAYKSITGKDMTDIAKDLDLIEIAPYKQSIRNLSRIEKIFRWWNKRLDKLKINGY